MSIVSKCKSAKREALRAYQQTKSNLRQQEIDAMNAALAVCKMTDNDGKPVFRTAEQIANAAGHNLSSFEVAGNFLAMKDGVSRHADFYGIRDHGFDKKASASISVKYGGHKSVRMAQIDDDGRIVPGTEAYIRRSLPNTYAVIEQDEKPSKRR